MDSIVSSLNFALQKTGSFFTGGQYPMVSVKSSIDNQSYNVRDMPDKQEAADMMARIRLKMKKLKIHLEATFPDKPQVILLKKNFDAEAHRLGEATPADEFTSFAVNKGESVHFCLRQREGENESIVDENIITFVSIHEMGHIITKSIGHGPDFWNNFGWLLQEAERINIYRHQNFAAHPVSYCGMKITDEPKYDAKMDGQDMSIGQVKA
jgi:hypothetical protein